MAENTLTSRNSLPQDVSTEGNPNLESHQLPASPSLSQLKHLLNNTKASLPDTDETAVTSGKILNARRAPAQPRTANISTGKILGVKAPPLPGE